MENNAEKGTVEEDDRDTKEEDCEAEKKDKDAEKKGSDTNQKDLTRIIPVIASE